MSRSLALHLTDTAEADLAEIWSYIASESSEPVATQWIEKVEAAFRYIQEFPLSCPSRDKLAKGLRVAFQGNYAIYYQSDDDAVVIIRVLHGARDVAIIAELGGFSVS